MSAFIIAMFFGVAQMLLLALLLIAVTSGNKKLAKKIFWIKLGGYCVGAVLFVFFFLSLYLFIIGGLAVGITVTALILFLYNVLFKKEDEKS